ncbi:phosphatase PAP2 family protein [Psychroserpens sp.]|uniref:phosphatase PAP2 family protein n=1 Tax=Psychroserpens sp. TaxID=2020870 RepID=UPI0038586511
MKIVICFLLFCVFTVKSQTLEVKNDSLKNIKTEKTFLKQTTVSRILIGSGVILSGTALENSIQRDVRNMVGSDFTTTIDDHLWKVPLVQMYSADLLGVESKNHWFDQSKNAFISHTLNKYATNAFKGLIGKERPSGYNNASFPSGHTSKAFTSATILYEEFKDTNPWLAYSGYVFASTTGFLRIAKNAHYLSDVLAGAGLGILITKLVYHFDYLFDWNPFKKKEDGVESLTTFNIAPTYNNQTIGLTAILQF